MQFPVYTNHNDQLYVKFERIDNPSAYVFDKLHAHQYHEIIFFEHGGGTHQIDTSSYTIQDYSLHILKAGSIHKIDRSIHSKGFAFVYNDTFLIQLQQLNPQIPYREYFFQNNVLDISNYYPQLQPLIVELYADIDKAYHNNLIGTILTKICLLYEKDTLTNSFRIHPKIIQLHQYLAAHFLEERSIEFYSNLMHISPQSLHVLIKQQTHKTFTELLDEHRLLYAKKALLAPLKQIYDISFQLQFNDSAYFSNWFKKKTGYTPSAYASLNQIMDN